MLKTFGAVALIAALPIGGVQAQEIVFSGVSPTSDDYQLGVVWSGLARDAGLSMTVVENGTVAGMRKAAQAEVDMVGVGAPITSTPWAARANMRRIPRRCAQATRR